MACNRTYSVLSGIFKVTNEAQPTSTLVSFRTLYKFKIFDEHPLPFHMELPPPPPPPPQVSKCLKGSERRSEGVKSSHHYSLESNKYFPILKKRKEPKYMSIFRSEKIKSNSMRCNCHYSATHPATPDLLLFCSFTSAGAVKQLRRVKIFNRHFKTS